MLRQVCRICAELESVGQEKYSADCRLRLSYTQTSGSFIDNHRALAKSMIGLSPFRDHPRTFLRTLSCVIGFLTVATVGTGHAAIAYNTIALSGATGTSLGLGPNLGAGVHFSDLSFPTVNASGQIAFNGTLTGAGVSTTNDSGIWSNVGGAVAVAAREGASGPGPNVGAGVNFSFFSSSLISNAGQIAFSATITGTGVDSSNETGVWTITSEVPSRSLRVKGAPGRGRI
jgi:hypothetical protein